jgi:hypothetical protein
MRPADGRTEKEAPMQRVPRRRLLAAILASLTLMATAIPPLAGVASAASTSTTCQDFEGITCFLGISAPQSVQTGVPFTVQVGVYVDSDRTILAKSDPCGSKAPVTLAVTAGESSPVSYFATASAAIATFSVTVSSDDFYTLDASAGFGESSSCSGYDFVGDSAEFTAVTIPATQPIAPCPDNVACTQVISGTGTGATLIGDEGTLFSPLFGSSFFSSFAASGLPASCGIPADPANGVLGFTHSPANSGPKTIIFALSSERVTVGIGQYNICWNSNTAFTPRGGGAPVFTGLLPNCKRNDVGPCVLFRKSNQHNVGFFGVLTPEWDPKGTPTHG